MYVLNANLILKKKIGIIAKNIFSDTYKIF